MVSHAGQLIIMSDMSRKNIQPDNDNCSVNKKWIASILLVKLYKKGCGEASHRSFF